MNLFNQPDRGKEERQSMEQHTYFWDNGIARMKNLYSLHDFFFFDPGVLIPSLYSRNPRKVGHGSNHFNLTIRQLGEVKHPLLNEDSVIGFQVIWKKRCVDKNFHGSIVS